MKTYIFFLFAFALSSVTLFSQNTAVKDNHKPIAKDCSGAIPIAINVNTYYGPSVPASGYGTAQEVSSPAAKCFDAEHNTAWYVLNIGYSGDLVFEIVPEDSTNDYDFELFRYTDSSFCNAFSTFCAKPLRSNLANLTKTQKGITGLQSGKEEELVGKGVNDPFSKLISVKKGERYMLVLDNVTDNGKGHTLFFNFVKNVELKGKVTDENNLPLVAEIILSDNKGKTVEAAKSDKKGEYKINTELKEYQDYNVTYSADKSFVQVASINTKTLKGKDAFPDIKTMLPELKSGAKYKLGNINFEGSNNILLRASYPSVEALYKLMKKNPHMQISIQGHVNNPITKKTDAEEMSDQDLSEARALTVYMSLVLKGIAKDRMTTEGFSSKQMLYPHPDTPEKNEANRRVEIKVISIE